VSASEMRKGSVILRKRVFVMIAGLNDKIKLQPSSIRLVKCVKFFTLYRGIYDGQVS
jgi:hypothetical protein